MHTPSITAGALATVLALSTTLSAMPTPGAGSFHRSSSASSFTSQDSMKKPLLHQHQAPPSTMQPHKPLSRGRKIRRVALAATGVGALGLGTAALVQHHKAKEAAYAAAAQDPAAGAGGDPGAGAGADPGAGGPPPPAKF